MTDDKKNNTEMGKQPENGQSNKQNAASEKSDYYNDNTLTVDDIKSRFKAGSIPLQSDFSNLIDIADSGRKAVGKSPDAKTKIAPGPGNGLALNNKDVLMVKADSKKGLTVTAEGVAVNLTNGDSGLQFKYGRLSLQIDPNDALKIEGNKLGIQRTPGGGIQSGPQGLKVQIAKDKGIGFINDGDEHTNGLGVQLYPDYGLAHDKSGIWVKVNKNKGVMVDREGVAVKVNTQKGLKVTPLGIEINDGLGLECCEKGKLHLKVKKDGGFSRGPDGTSVIPGNGVAVNSCGINVKLAKGTHNNGGGGQGDDGATSGAAGGLILNSNGLSVDAGSGIQINPKGVSLKLANNSGLTADENDGLKIKPGNGISVDGNGIKLADDSWIRVFCQMTGSYIYGFNDYVFVTVVVEGNNVMVRFWGRGVYIPLCDRTPEMNNYKPVTREVTYHNYSGKQSVWGLSSACWNMNHRTGEGTHLHLNYGVGNENRGRCMIILKELK